MDTERVDVIIVGGGPAGLSAALYLGRARRSVVVIDRGKPRHAVAEGVHNFLTRDGYPPAALRVTAWEQLASYPSVRRQEGNVTALQQQDGIWHAQLEDGSRIAARAILLATGVIDEHPPVRGYQERWGHSIHQCPFCHGWEMQDRPLAVMAHGEAAGHYVPLIRNWSDDVVLLTNGHGLPNDVRQHLLHAGLHIFDAPVEALEGPGRELERILLADGTSVERQGVFIKTNQRQVDLVRDLGVRLTAQGHVEIDMTGATSLPMVWAAGDLTSQFQQVVEAAAQGARAAGRIVASLINPAP